jgi:phage shock protein A
MPYFSRLTDIVTCNLSSILAHADDPRQALEEVLREMNEGLAGAERSVRTAGENVGRIEDEIGEQRAAAANWVREAEQALQAGNEEQARQALVRKHEVEDLIAGLEQQLQAAVATRDHLRTMLSAIQARHADARRRLDELAATEGSDESAGPSPAATRQFSSGNVNDRIEQELEQMRRKLQPPSG